MKTTFLVALFTALAVFVNAAVAEEKKAEAPKAEKADKEKKTDKKDGKGKKLSDEEQLKENANALIEAFKAKDVEKVMAHFSDKFQSSKLQDKAALQALIDMANNSGFLDGMELDSKDMKVAIEGEKATVAPVAISGGFGAGTASFICTKEGDKWMVTSMELDGIDI